MSHRSVKKTMTTTTVQSASSSSSSAEKSPSGRYRPPSPARISRLQEKDQLIDLNNRLANYIEHIRSLETENSKLQVQVRQYEETSTREVTNIKALYETELAEARKLLDATAREKARLQIDVGKYKSEAEEWMIKFNKRDKEANSFEKRALDAEARMKNAETRAADAEEQKKRAQAELARIRGEFATLERQLATAKKQLEEETLLRVDLENRVQSLKEELQFKSQIHAQELNETRTRTEISMEEVDSHVEGQYEGKLSEALREMRVQFDYQIKIQREETEALYEAKMADLRLQAERGTSSADYSRSELKVARKTIDELNTRITTLSTQIATLEGRVRDIESQLLREKELYSASLDAKNSELSELRLQMEDQMREYQDLMDIKLALDLEIAAYRKLLEGEEARLQLSISQEGTPGRTPFRPTPSRSGKRKRVALEEASMQQSASSAYATKSTATGKIEIREVDPEGKFIKLFNNSEKELSIGNWQLKHKSGKNDTAFKFHRSVKVEPNGYCTIYGSNAGETHQPPSQLVMKGQQWFVGDNMKTLLANSQGQEVASCEMSRSARKITFTSGDTVDGEGDPDEGNKTCIVM